MGWALSSSRRRPGWSSATRSAPLRRRSPAVAWPRHLVQAQRNGRRRWHPPSRSPRSRCRGCRNGNQAAERSGCSRRSTSSCHRWGPSRTAPRSTRNVERPPTGPSRTQAPYARRRSTSSCMRAERPETRRHPGAIADEYSGACAPPWWPGERAEIAPLCCVTSALGCYDLALSCRNKRRLQPTCTAQQTQPTDSRAQPPIRHGLRRLTPRPAHTAIATQPHAQTWPARHAHAARDKRKPSPIRSSYPAPLSARRARAARCKSRAPKRVRCAPQACHSRPPLSASRHERVSSRHQLLLSHFRLMGRHPSSARECPRRTTSLSACEHSGTRVATRMGSTTSADRVSRDVTYGGSYE